MHLSSIRIAAVLIVLYLTFVLAKWVSAARRRAAKAQQWGCQSAPFDVYSDKLGILNVLRIIKADRNKSCPDHYLERFKKNSQHYGRNVTTVACRVLGVDAYITCDVKNIQALLATQFNDFGLGANRHSIFLPLMGNGIFSTDGDQWSQGRAWLRPQFARELVSDLSLEEHHFQNLLRAIGEADADSGWTPWVDLQPLFYRLTLDSASEFLFGESVGTQILALPGSESKMVHGGIRESDFAALFDEVQDWMAFASRLGYWNKLGQTRRFHECVRRLHRFVDHYVEKAIKEVQSSGSDEKPKRYNLLRAIAEVQQDPQELRGQLLSLLVAGRDSTASLLGWLFLLLARHPAIYDDLRTAILHEFGTWDESRELTFESLKSCNLLQHCISETLRLFPVVPLNGRTALHRDTTLPTGGGPDGDKPVFVPMRMEIQYCVHALHRRKDIWGDDTEEFRPGRWKGRKTGWEYIPFNGGPRACLGQQFALTEVAYIAVRLLQRFERMDGSAVADMKIRHGLTLANAPYDGVTVRFKLGRP